MRPVEATTLKQGYRRANEGVKGTDRGFQLEPPWEKTKAYRHLLSPETLAKVEAIEAKETLRRMKLRETR